MAGQIPFRVRVALSLVRFELKNATVIKHGTVNVDYTFLWEHVERLTKMRANEALWMQRMPALQTVCSSEKLEVIRNTYF